jgi:hypothetical protein
MMTVHSLRLVCYDLVTNHSFRFVLTSRFNQDVVENWFSCVRGKGRNNDSRTTLEYESASKSITVNWLLESPERGSNCELDFDRFIGLVNKSFDHKTSSDSTLNLPRPDVLDETTNDAVDDKKNAECSDGFTDVFEFTSDWSQMFSLTDVDSNVVCYIAGYICAKLNKKLSCVDCTTAYIASQETWKKVESLEHTLIQMRNFSWAKYGLAVPSPQVADLCNSIERVFQMNVEGLMVGSHLMTRLKEIICSCIQVDSYYVDACCSKHQVYWISSAITIFF